MDKRVLSVGVADLNNFGKIADSQGAVKAVEVLQDAFTATGEIIIAHGGHVVKYLGDAFLFAFEDTAEAVAAAREIASSYGIEVGSLVLTFTVSVATGTVLVGEVGHPDFAHEDVMGDTVNTAFELQKKAKQAYSGVAFCEETLKHA